MYQKENPETIREMFNSIAKRYDRANGVMSLQMHRLWNRRLIRDVIEATQPRAYLDLCSGTGEIALSYLQSTKEPCKATLLDFSPGMLQYAKMKSAKPCFAPHQLSFLEADAQQIPLPDSSIDTATMAYGIRNIKDPAKCARDVARVLKPGGTFGILELTRPSNALIRLGHQLYLKTVLPVVGRLVSENQQAYEYLCSSIDRFVSPKELVATLKQSGFSDAKAVPLLGGIATLFIAKK